MIESLLEGKNKPENTLDSDISFISRLEDNDLCNQIFTTESFPEGENKPENI